MPGPAPGIHGVRHAPAAHTLDATPPMTTFRPTDAEAVQHTVAWAVGEGQSLEIMGGGTKRALGRPPQTDHILDLAALSGIIDYDPSELVLTAQAATPMATIQALLDAERQMLAFEPPDLRALLPSTAEPTLGGTIACNLAGPRRVRAGAARDHFLGFAAVNGWGDPWKAGGRVVKNVTGYDLCKLQAGAFGTLSVLTELTIRVLPRPEASCTLLLSGLDDPAAIRAMATALNAPHEVSATAHLPAAAARRAGLPGPATLFRLEGHRPSIASRATALASLLPNTERLEQGDSESLWTRIGAAQPLLPQAPVLWRLGPTPSEAAAVFARVHAKHPTAEALYDWGGGLLWIALPDPGPDSGPDSGPDCAAPLIRAALQGQGHATLIRAPDAARAVIPPFHPTPGPLTALTRRVKASFDPNGTLNPGRMQQGV